MPQNTIIPYEPHLLSKARELRKRMTIGEVLLWQRIRKRKLGVQFHRQVPVNKYIIDFYCHELMLAIEIDGDYHNRIYQSSNDQIRQDILEDFGITILRFTEKEVTRNPDMVTEEIWVATEELKSGGNKDKSIKSR
jgi:very-short-patch-repair endonuclease